ncbi:MAG: PKD domain-containing protein [Bacteroidales bacterium]|jgi:PKD repeat protein|nr:PKD domain-containing protein [Bacteroidales bacterium]
MRKNIASLLILVIISTLTVGLNGQTVKPEKITKAKYFDRSKALRDVDPISMREDTDAWKYYVIPNKFNFSKSTDFNSNYKGPDPVLQNHTDGVRNEPTINANFDGVTNTYSVAPPDTQGDVGLDHYMQMVNKGFAIWDKEGSLLYGPTNNIALWDGFDGPWSGTNDGDPIVVYDEYADRWVASQFSLPNGSNTGPYYELIAVSVTDDPLGEWYRYAYEFDKMPDYPKFGVWHNAYCFTINQFLNGSWYGGGISVLDREAMLAGDPDAEMVFFNMGSGFGSMLPADADGAIGPDEDTPIYLVKGGTNSLRLIEVIVDWDNSNNNEASFVANIPVASYSSSGISISQPGTGQKLDALSDRLMYRLQYRNFENYEVMLANHTVNAGSGRAGVRWYELRNYGEEWEMYQQGTYAPDDGNSRWMASIAMNQNGDISVGYSLSGSSTYPSIAVTGQTAANSGSGEFDITETIIKAGNASQTGVNRWGDYSMMSVDPDDDQTFWFTTEYTNGGWNWRTQIASFGYVQIPVVNFSANETLIPLNQTINFTDRTVGIPTEWLWTFEGGTPEMSTEKDPQNIQYETEGEFDVTLIATNELGTDTLVKEDYVIVSASLLPSVDFVANKDVFCLGEAVMFTDQTQYSPIQWHWEFDPPTVTFINETDETSQHPEVEFNEAATYDVALTAWNLNGESTLSKTDFILAGGYTPYFNETFEQDGFRDQYWTIENPDDDVTWEIYEVAGNGSGFAAGINFTEYFAIGQRDRLVSPPLNLNGLSSASLSFKHAFAKRLDEVSDSLIIYISSDCGATWTRIFADAEDGSGNFATHEMTEDFWPQTASDWCISGWGASCIDIDLSPWAGNADVQIAFETYSFYGNPLFIDNISVSQYVDVETNTFNDEDIQVYPNPNSGRFTIVIPKEEVFEKMVVYDQIGRIVYSEKLNDQQNTIRIQIGSEWQNGIYLIRLINSEQQIITKKVIVNK